MPVKGCQPASNDVVCPVKEGFTLCSSPSHASNCSLNPMSLREIFSPILISMDLRLKKEETSKNFLFHGSKGQNLSVPDMATGMRSLFSPVSSQILK